MSVLRNLLNAIVPIRERRESFGSLAATNATLTHDCNGCESAIIYLNAGAGTWNATIELTGSVDGTNFFPVLGYPYTPGCTGGTIPVAAQPLIVEAINTTSVQRAYAVACGQLKLIRIRSSVWTAGSADVTIISEQASSMHPNVAAQRAGTLLVSATGTVGLAATATLPAVAGLRHYLDFISVTRSATAALTASATPIITSSTNLPGAPVLTFGADVGGIGVDKEQKLDFGASGLAAVGAGVATTFVCPATAGVIWRINAAYRLGL